MCNRAVICLLRVFSLKFGPIIHASPMLPLLPFSPPPLPPVIVELVQLGCVLRSIVWAVWRERVVDSPESRRPILSARHVTASSDMRLAGAAASRRTQPSVGKEEERASEGVEVNS